jgi:hypothetical protein
MGKEELGCLWQNARTTFFVDIQITDRQNVNIQITDHQNVKINNTDCQNIDIQTVPKLKNFDINLTETEVGNFDLKCCFLHNDNNLFNIVFQENRQKIGENRRKSDENIAPPCRMIGVVGHQAEGASEEALRDEGGSLLQRDPPGGHGLQRRKGDAFEDCKRRGRRPGMPSRFFFNLSSPWGYQ